MANRDKLLNEMSLLIIQSKWQEYLQEGMSQVIQVQPDHPYVYFQQKNALRIKMDNFRHTLYLLELTMYINNADPKIISREKIWDKITYLCIEKYHQNKVRKFQCIQLVQILLIEFQQKQKQHFMNLLNRLLDCELMNICTLKVIIYYCMVYRQMLLQINELDTRLNRVGQHLTSPVMQQYINTVNEEISIIKKWKVDLEAQGDLYRIVGQFVVVQINI